MTEYCETEIDLKSDAPNTVPLGKIAVGSYFYYGNLCRKVCIPNGDDYYNTFDVKLCLLGTVPEHQMVTPVLKINIETITRSEECEKE